MGAIRKWIGSNRVVAGVLAGVVAVAAVAGITLAVIGGGSDSTRGATQEQSSKPNGKPRGTFGSTEGANVEIAPGLVALSFTAPEGGRGRITLDGPAHIVLEGEYVFTDDSNWTIAIDDSRGTVAGVELMQGESYGTIINTAATVTSDVTVGVSAQPEIVPEWNQSTNVRVTYAKDPTTKQALVGDVNVTTSRGPNQLSGAGRLGEDDTYTLPMAGTIQFAGASSPLSGDYRGVAVRSGRIGSDHSWTIAGSGARGALTEATVPSFAVAMDESVPGVTGAATVWVPGPFQMNLFTSMWFVDGGDWSLDVTSTDRAELDIPNLDQLDADLGDTDGTIESERGVEHWSLRAPMTVDDDGSTMSGEIVIAGPERFDLEGQDVYGTILGSDLPIGDEAYAEGIVAYDHGSISGGFMHHAGGERLLQMPEGWDHTAHHTVTYSGSTTTGVNVDRSVEYHLTNGDSRIILSGDIDSNDVFELAVSGQAMVHNTPVPFSGSYKSDDSIHEGRVLTEPRVEMIGDISLVPGGITLENGTAITAGTFGFSQGLTEIESASTDEGGFGVASISPSASAPKASGTFYITVSRNNPWPLKTTVSYTDQNNWTATVVTTNTDPWVVSGAAWVAPGTNSLRINPNKFSGTITDTNGAIDWEISIAEITWTNSVTGMTLVSDFSLSSSCPLDDEDNCPDATGLFFGMENGSASFPVGSPIPSLSMDGAFLTDGTWWRFDASPGDITVGEVTVSEPTLTMWKGVRKDSFDADLQMPDLSALSAGFQTQFCGDFTIVIPDIHTVKSGGCVNWTKLGVVMAQLAPGGSVTSGTSSGGVTIGGTTLDGWAWTNLTTLPTVTMNGVSMALSHELNQLTGTMSIPKKLMKATGNADKDATITATGWYKTGDFSLDSTIAVNMKSGGVKLDSVSVHIGKEGSHFSLELGANATVSMGGNQFPVTADIALGVGGGDTEITVSVTAKGAVNNDPTGGFDTASLLPTGTFEPDFDSIIDGSFDSKQSSPLNDDPGFEKSTGPTNLFTNPDFESGVSTGVFYNGDFESGNTGNVFPNGDGENTELLVNGDFESGDFTNWMVDTPSFTASNPSGSAPSSEPGSWVANLNNGGSTNTAAGLHQVIPVSTVAGAKYRVSAWVKSNDASNGRAVLFLSQQGTAATCSTQANTDYQQSFTVTPSWQQVTMDVTAVACHTQLQVFLNAPDSGDTVQFDSASVTVVSSPSGFSIPMTSVPQVTDDMGSMTGRTTSGTVAVATDVNGNTIKTSSGSSWMYTGTGYGYASGDFNVSYDIYFAGSGGRDAVSLGFWMQGTTGSHSGYGLRLQSATGNNNDSGIWTISSGSEQSRQGNGYGALSRGIWYRANISTSGSTVTVTVTNLSDGTTWATWSVTLPSGNRSGAFGENKPATSTSDGHRVDNITINLGSNPAQVDTTQVVRNMFDSTNSHSGLGYLAVNSMDANWFHRWSTGEVPNVNDSYSLTAWIRSQSGTINGTLGLDTDGGTYESSTRAFTATNTWTKVTVTVPMVQPGHTDVRWFVRDLSNSGAVLEIDDIVVQSKGQWSATGTSSGSAIEYAQYNAGPNTDVAHGGIGSLVLTDRAGGSWFSLNGIPPRSGATYTASFWMKSESGTATGLIMLSTIDASGSPVQATSPVAFTATTTWQQFTVPMTVNASGMASIQLQIEVSGNKTVRIDDLTATVTGADVPQEVDQAWGPQTTFTDFSNLGSLPIAKTSGVSSATDFANGGTSLTTNGNRNGFMFNSNSWGYTTSDFEMSVDVYFPSSSSRDIANIGFWMSGSPSAPTGYAFRLDTADPNNVGFITNNGSNTKAWVDQSVTWGSASRETWYRVKLTSSGAQVSVVLIDLTNSMTVGSQTVTMPSGNRSGALGQMPDTAGAAEGSRWDNFQVFRGSPVTANQKVILDATKAHSGNAALQITAPSGSTATATRTVGPAPTPGSTYIATAWVRSSSGSVAGTIKLEGQSAVTTSFTATTTWQQVTVTTAMGSGSASGLTTTFTNNSGNSTLIVDDVSVQIQGYTQQQPWLPATSSGGSISQTVWNDATKAHGGSNYLEVQPKFTDGNLYKETSLTLTSGEVYTASFWVKSKSGANQNGSFALMQGTYGTNARRIEFTATGTWQQVFVTLPITSSSPGTLTTNFYFPSGAGALLIDDVQVQKDAWGLTQPANTTVNQLVDQDGGAASGAGYLRVVTTGANAGIAAVEPASLVNGTVYTIEAYVRSTTGVNVAGSLKLTAQSTNSSQVASTSFTANEKWQYVTFDLTSNGSYTSLKPEVILTSAGQLDVDEIKVMPKVVIQDDPWTTTVGAGGSVSATIYADSTNAHDSLGVMRVSKTGANDSSIQHTIAAAPAPGSTYVLTAWVRSVSSLTMNGEWKLSTQGGTLESVTQTFQTDSTWQMVTLSLPVTNSGHTSMVAQMVMHTSGVEVWVDDVYVQSATWQTGASSVDTTVQAKQMNDASKAQSGSGYESIRKTGGSDGWLTRTTSGSMPNNYPQAVEAYVRSADGTDVTGRIKLTASGGSGTDVATSSEFTATKNWQKVSVSVPITQDGRNSLQTQIFVDTQGKWLDIDSIVVGQAPLGEVDGIEAPLSHPNTGYTYLWDDAFGIPGAHLWSITAQIQIKPEGPGLGVGATMYQDPTKMSTIMTGTDWLYSKMDLNISRAEPCLAFKFDGSSGNSGIHIDGGVFTTKEFDLSIAPKGCQIGDDVIPAGASIGFHAALGDGTVYLEMAISKDDNGHPEFHADMGVSNIKIGGFVFNAMELKVDITVDSSSEHFLGDFQLPMGNFYADYNLEMNTDELRMDGQVSVTNWTMKSTDFSVQSFTYHQVMDVPLGTGKCGTFDVEASGNLTMKSKHYAFNAVLAMDCGSLKQLHFDYQYSKSGVFYTFNIDYDSKTRVLAGGLEFNFDKKISWKYVGIKHTRHPQFAIKLEFEMPIDNPSAGMLSLYGSISVSGGNGTVSCTFGSSGDDGCSLHVHVNVFGGQTLDTSW